jgi:hypothetical protein
MSNNRPVRNPGPPLCRIGANQPLTHSTALSPEERAGRCDGHRTPEPEIPAYSRQGISALVSSPGVLFFFFIVGGCASLAVDLLINFF